MDCVAQEQRQHPQSVTAVGVPQRTQTAKPVPFAGIPIVTYTLIALNVLAYIATAAQSSSILDNHRGSALFERLVLAPGMVANGDFIRLIGSGFLHYGILHLAVNMYALYIVGIACENALGRIRYTAVYFLSLLGGSAAVMFGAVNAGTAGASGAVFGLFGAILIILLRLKRNANMIIGVIVLNVIISVSVPGISWLGHFGGFAAGTVATAAIIYAPKLLELVGRKTPSPRQIAQLGFGFLGALLVVEVAMITVRVLALREQYGPFLSVVYG